jgi:hypothetical protein
LGGAAANGHGQAAAVFESNSNGTGRLLIYNGLKTTGAYGTSDPARGFRVQIEGGNVDSFLSANCTLGLISNANWCGLGMHAGGTQSVIRVSTTHAGFSFGDGGGVNYVPLHASAFTVNSSRSSKRSIQPMTAPAAPTLLALKPCAFERPGVADADGKRGPSTHHLGLVAEEVVDVVPEAVSWMNGKPESLDYVPITATLIKGFQEHEQRLTTLRDDLDKLAASVVVKPR